MIKFKDKKNNVIKEAYSIKENGDKYTIQFLQGGKEYVYYKNNIELLSTETYDGKIMIYQFQRECIVLGWEKKVLKLCKQCIKVFIKDRRGGLNYWKKAYIMLLYSENLKVEIPK